MAIALVAHVARATGGSGGGTSTGIDTSGANFLVMAVGFENNLFFPSDSKSNVWSPIGTVSSTIAQQALALFVAVSPTVGTSHTFTVTGATIFPTFCVAAFSGVGTGFVLDLPMTGSQTAGGTSRAPGSLTPNTNNCLVIASLAYRDTTTISVNGGFTITDQCPFIAATAVGSALAYLIQTSAAASNPTFSWTNSVAASAYQFDVQSSGTTPMPFGGSVQ